MRSIMDQVEVKVNGLNKVDRAKESIGLSKSTLQGNEFIPNMSHDLHLTNFKGSVRTKSEFTFTNMGKFNIQDTKYTRYLVCSNFT